MASAPGSDFPDASMDFMLVENNTPRMTSNTQQTGSLHTDCVIECVSESIPHPDAVVWSKDGQQIDTHTSDRISQQDLHQHFGVLSKLQLSSVVGQDFGAYNCSVTNSYGTAWQLIYLTG